MGVSNKLFLNPLSIVLTTTKVTICPPNCPKKLLVPAVLLPKNLWIIFTFWPIHENKATQIFSFFQFVKIIHRKIVHIESFVKINPWQIYHISRNYENFFSRKFFPLTYMIIDGQENLIETNNRFLDFQETTDLPHHCLLKWFL